MGRIGKHVTLGSFPRWQSFIGLPSRAKLALRRAAMEQHCHSYPRTPYVVRHRKEGPFMGRLRANLSALGNPMQDFHSLKWQRELRIAFLLPARPGWSFPIGLRNTEFFDKELTPLSSVAYGATSFLRKEAIALRHMPNGQAPSPERSWAKP